MNKKALLLGIIACIIVSIQAVPAILDGILDTGVLYNYEDQAIPDYIFREDVHQRPISDEVSTLGRVLFYDKQLSLNSSLACAGCHKQEFAFGDTLVASPGFDKINTERHSTRLVNLNFSHMPEVFWDRRAGHLDSLPLMVLSNSIEMGFSGKDGQPAVDSLIKRLEAVPYYDELFQLAYDDEQITEAKVNLALTEFVRSIVSYDSKYDVGRTMVDSVQQLFPNFTAEENRGKELYLSPFSDPIPQFFVHDIRERMEDKMGCADCHGIDNFTSRKTSLTGNNGIVGVIDHPNEVDTTVKRSPSLRDLVNRDGIELGPFMHDGSLSSLAKVVEHYNTIGIREKTIGLHPNLNIDVPNGTYTDPTGGGAQGPSGFFIPSTRIDLEEEKALVAFLKTLTGSNIYTDPKWSDPFDEEGRLRVETACASLIQHHETMEICEGDSYRGFFTPGIHKKRIANPTGCDSLVTVEIAIRQSPEKTETVTICESEDYYGHTDAGSYVDMLPSTNGCDTIRYLEMEVIPLQRQYRYEYFCAGDSFEGYTEPGTYYDTIPNSDGCYTQVYMRLRYQRLNLQREYVEICPGSSYNGYTRPGWYTDTLDCYNGIRTQIVFIDGYEISEEHTICEGENLYGYSTSGEYTDVFSSVGECDSTRYLTLHVAQPSESYQLIEICEGESFINYSTTGLHHDIFVNAEGCDSTRYIDLIVLPHSESYLSESICEGETLYGYDVSGSYTDVFTNALGCDSTRHLHLEILESTESFIPIAICEGESYEGYTKAGVYTDLLTNLAGCDSTRQIELVVLEHTQSEIELELCLGEEYESYRESGQYEDVFQNAAGCDSTRYVSLEILLPSESYTEMSICEGEEQWGYDRAGVYEDALTNAVGCDSFRVLDLSILEHSESYEEVHLCPGEEYEGYSEGSHEESYVNAVGCDSLRQIEIVKIAYDDAICSPQYDKQPKMMSETAYMSASPNPVVDYLNLNISKAERLPAEVRIYDSNHRMIFAVIVHNMETSIDFTGYDAGLYIVHVKDGENMFLTKVLKM